MTVRSATLDDLTTLEELWRAFEAEVPPPAHEEAAGSGRTIQCAGTRT